MLHPQPYTRYPGNLAIVAPATFKRTSRTLLRVIAIALSATSLQAIAIENNSYLLLSKNIPDAGNGVMVDAASGKVTVGSNAGVTVWPAGGAASPLLTIPAGSASPVGAAIVGGNYYVPKYWNFGSPGPAIVKYDASGQNPVTVLSMNNEQAGANKNVNINNVVVNSAGNLVMSALDLPQRLFNNDGVQHPGVLITDTAGNILAHTEGPSTGSLDGNLVAVDSKDNVYVASWNGLHVFDKNLVPLEVRQYNRLTGAPDSAGQVEIGGVAIDKRDNLYLVLGRWNCNPCTLAKYDASGNQVGKSGTTNATPLYQYGTNLGGGYGGNYFTSPIAVDPTGKYIYVLHNPGGYTKILEQQVSAPPAPVLSASGAVSPVAVTATWPAPADPVSSYSLQISTDQTNWTTINVPGTQTSKVLTTADFAALAPAGTYYLQIAATDLDGTSPYSNVATAQIPLANSTTTATASPATLSIGGTATINVTVAAQTASDGAPSGTVNVSDGSANCTATLTNGAGSCSLTPTGLGQKTITATYVSDGKFSASSATTQVTVAVVATTLALTSSANPSTSGSPVTFTANLSGVQLAVGTTKVSKAAPEPTGTVTFTDNGQPLGSATVSGGTASFTANSLSVGSHTIVATYSGDANNSGNTATLIQVVQADVPVTPPPGNTAPIPTLSQWGLLMLASVMALFGVRRVCTKSQN